MSLYRDYLQGYQTLYVNTYIGLNQIVVRTYSVAATQDFLYKLSRFLASTGRNQSFEFNNSSNYKYPNGTYDYDKIKGATSQFFGQACDNVS